MISKTGSISLLEKKVPWSESKLCLRITRAGAIKRLQVGSLLAVFLSLFSAVAAVSRDTKKAQTSQGQQYEKEVLSKTEDLHWQKNRKEALLTFLKLHPFHGTKWNSKFYEIASDFYEDQVLKDFEAVRPKVTSEPAESLRKIESLITKDPYNLKLLLIRGRIRAHLGECDKELEIQKQVIDLYEVEPQFKALRNQLKTCKMVD